MANSENAKLKILMLYDYFLHEVGPTDSDGVTLQEILDMLESRLETKFERKSIYADISRINEYITLEGSCKGDFIGRDGKKYLRGLLKDEIMLEEAKMISDSLRTTEFISDELCMKFEKMFPAYFGREENSQAARLYSRHIRKNTATMKMQWANTQKVLLNIRTSMEKKAPMLIEYGYKGDQVNCFNNYLLTPLKIDWTNSHYYLIAIDHLDLYRKAGFKKNLTNKQLSGSIKRFRLDRIYDNEYVSSKDNLEFINRRLPAHYAALFENQDSGKISKPEKKSMADKYMTFLRFSSDEEQERVVDAYINSSLDAFSSSETPVRVNLSIEADPAGGSKDTWKQVLVAFSTIKDEFEVKNINERYSKMRIDFTIITPLTKTLYKHLFSIYTMDGIRFNIENETVRTEMLEYVNKIRDILSV